jgi:hypothetical protein
MSSLRAVAPLEAVHDNIRLKIPTEAGQANLASSRPAAAIRRMWSARGTDSNLKRRTLANMQTYDRQFFKTKAIA